MNIREIAKPVTAKALNESLAKRFGKKIDLESFTVEQLQDARNKLRTTLSQFETNESFDSVHTSETYQKNKLFLDVLNAAVAEATIQEKQSPAQKAAFEKMMKNKGKGKAKDKKASKGQKPDYIDIDNDGNETEPMSQAAKDAKQESVVREGKEDEAELVMASKDMVTRVTSWMEDTAEMQTESMLELADAIRDEMGQAQSDSFVSIVKPSLESMYTAMESTREALTQGVGMLTGEGEAPAEDMGTVPAEPDAEADAEMEPTVDQEDADAAADEFAAAEAGVGGEEEAGRDKRESRIHKKKMIESSRRLGTILSKKKK